MFKKLCIYIHEKVPVILIIIMIIVIAYITFTNDRMLKQVNSPLNAGRYSCVKELLFEM